jgi:hypothetical protein
MSHADWRVRNGTTRSPAMNDDPVEFWHDNDGFYAWLERHQGGFFVNNSRPGKSTHLFLHCSPCPHYTKTDGIDYTTNPKMCSQDRSAIERWAVTVGWELDVCTGCFG